MRGRLISTVLALLALVLVLRFLPPATRNARANVQRAPVQVSASDLQFSGLQMSKAIGGEALYLDGMVTNNGDGTLKGATAKVTFLDSNEQVAATVEKPLVGVARGGVDGIANEFARNPITPKEVRFFRVSVEQVPPTWNHEVPELEIIAVKPQ